MSPLRRSFPVRLLTMVAAAVLAAALAAPAPAAEFKYTGVYRFRTVTAENNDKDDRTQDSAQYGEMQVLPRFTALSEGGRVQALYEFAFDATEITFGKITSRPSGGLNRFLVDFAIPGTQLRARWGKTDWMTAEGELASINGDNRIMGYGAYGRLGGPLSLSLWTTKYSEGYTAASDGDVWYGGLRWQAAPAFSITPYILWDHKNGLSASADSPEYDLQWYALSAKARLGRADVQVTGVWQDGEVDFGRSVNASGRRDIRVEAWAALLRLWLTFGRLRVGFYGTFTSGDGDRTSRTGLLGRQPDGRLGRFSTPRQNKVGWFDGPQIAMGRRYHCLLPFRSIFFRTGSGNGGGAANGARIYEVLAAYRPTGDLLVEGNVSLIRAVAKRADLDADWDGVAESSYSGARDIGTEVDLSLRYSLYRSLWVRVTGAYLFVGDYGKSDAPDARGFDDAWAGYFEIVHKF